MASTSRPTEMGNEEFEFPNAEEYFDAVEARVTFEFGIPSDGTNEYDGTAAQKVFKSSGAP